VRNFESLKIQLLDDQGKIITNDIRMSPYKSKRNIAATWMVEVAKEKMQDKGEIVSLSIRVDGESNL
jgi:hypothetical protein